MIKRLDKLMCSTCHSQWWTKIEDGKVCNCPQCGSPEHEKVDEWEEKAPIRMPDPLPSRQVFSTHDSSTEWCTVTTGGMLDLRGMP